MNKKDFIQYSTRSIAKLFLLYAKEETFIKLSSNKYEITHRDKTTLDLFSNHLSKNDFYEIYEVLPIDKKGIIRKELFKQEIMRFYA